MSSHDLAGCMLSLGRATSLNSRARWICILHANAMAHGWYGSITIKLEEEGIVWFVVGVVCMHARVARVCVCHQASAA
jgi:hypothetical protein